MVVLTYVMLNFTNLTAVYIYATKTVMPPNQYLNTLLEYAAIAIILLMTVINFIVMIKISVGKLLLVCKKRKIQKASKLQMKKTCEEKIAALTDKKL